MLASGQQCQPPKGRGRGRVGGGASPSYPHRGEDEAAVTQAGGTERLEPTRFSAETQQPAAEKQRSPRLAGRGRARLRKPEQQLYVPRGRRSEPGQVSDKAHTKDSPKAVSKEQARSPDPASSNPTEQVASSYPTEQVASKPPLLPPSKRQVSPPFTHEQNSPGSEGQCSSKMTRQVSSSKASKKSRPVVQVYVPRGRRLLEEQAHLDDDVENASSSSVHWQQASADIESCESGQQDVQADSHAHPLNTVQQNDQAGGDTGIRVAPVPSSHSQADKIEIESPSEVSHQANSADVNQVAEQQCHLDTDLGCGDSEFDQYNVMGNIDRQSAETQPSEQCSPPENTISTASGSQLGRFPVSHSCPNALLITEDTGVSGPGLPGLTTTTEIITHTGDLTVTECELDVNMDVHDANFLENKLSAVTATSACLDLLESELSAKHVQSQTGLDVSSASSADVNASQEVLSVGCVEALDAVKNQELLGEDVSPAPSPAAENTTGEDTVRTVLDDEEEKMSTDVTAEELLSDTHTSAATQREEEEIKKQCSDGARPTDHSENTLIMETCHTKDRSIDLEAVTLDSARSSSVKDTSELQSLSDKAHTDREAFAASDKSSSEADNINVDDTSMVTDSSDMPIIISDSATSTPDSGEALARTDIDVEDTSMVTDSRDMPIMISDSAASTPDSGEALARTDNIKVEDTTIVTDSSATSMPKSDSATCTTDARNALVRNDNSSEDAPVAKSDGATSLFEAKAADSGDAPAERKNSSISVVSETPVISSNAASLVHLQDKSFSDAEEVSNAGDMGSPRNDEDEEDDCWDQIFDDNGDCLEPDVMEELTEHVGEVEISRPKKTINYLDFTPKELDMDMTSYSHVIEISDFPAEFQTRDLLTAFKDYMSRGFDVKWVDDTHALGIFSSTIAAMDALKMIHPMMKLRPLSEASKQSRSKAKRTQEFLQPYKARPVTSSAAARRLVSGALGLAVGGSREQRAEERKVLKEARDKKRQARKQKDAIWDGDVGKCAMDKC